MGYELFSDVILLHDVPQEELCAGDVGTVVEQHHVEGIKPGYTVEFFDMVGNIVAVVTLPESSLRAPTRADRPTIRLIDDAA
ncbi:MAG: DUF4926 domain-containing protein [Elainella sp. C42_A2020_010]|nr:DUF4926 domain-containing protein [Elainella sp. C42_A2020_010]